MCLLRGSGLTAPLITLITLLALGCGGPEPLEEVPSAPTAPTVDVAPAQPAPAEILPAPRPASAEMRSRLDGQVIDADGAPVANVTVKLLRHTEVLASGFPTRAGLWNIAAAREAATDEHGVFAIDAIPQGRWWLAVSPAANEMWVLPAPLSLGLGVRGRFRIAGNANLTSVIVRLPNMTTFSGRVLTAAEEHVADASLHFAAANEDGWWVTRATSGAAGNFSLTAIRAPRESHLLVRAAGRAPVWARRWEIPALRGQSLPDIVMFPGAALEGIVYGPGGEPVREAQVWAVSEIEIAGEAHPLASEPTPTDERGAFDLRDLAGGAIDLHASMPGLRLDAPVPSFAVPGDVLLGAVISLRESESLDGTILDANGQPVAGAIVQILPPERPFADARPWTGAPPPPARPDLWTLTDAAGAFSLDGVRAGTHPVGVIADAEPLARFRDLAVGESHALTLPAPAGMRGRVTSAVTGEGLGLAHVRATHDESEVVETTFTTGRGDFQALFLPAGEHRVHAVATAHAGRTLNGVTTSAFTINPDVNLQLPPGTTVSGHVRNSLDQSPVAAAEVTLRGRDQDLVASSDAEGFFEIDHVGPDSWRAGATAPLFAPSAPLGVPVETTPVAGLELHLEPAARIQGRVTDLAGHPVGGATVGVRYERRGGGGPPGANRQRLQRSTLTETDGRYTLDGLLPDRLLAVIARHPSYAQAQAESLRVAPGATREPVDLILTEGGTLVGRVVNEHELPFVDAEVRFGRQREGGRRFGQRGAIAVLFQSGEQGERVSLTDNQGRFRFEHLTPATYTVLARAEDHPYETAEDVEVLEGLETPEVLLHLFPGVTISGRVEDTAGVPIGAAQVTAFVRDQARPRFERTVTGEDGSFEMTGLEERAHSVAAEAEGFDRASQDVEAPASGVVLVLERGGTLRGRVVDAVTTSPISRFNVHAQRAGRRWQVVEQEQEFSHPNGEFVLEGLVAGQWDITVTAAAHAPARAERLDVVNEQETDAGTLELPRGGTLRGTVVTSTAPPRPIADATVQVTEGRGQSAAGPPWMRGGNQRPTDAAQQTTTDSEGRFELAALPPGQASIRAWSPDHLESDAEVTIPDEGDPEEITIALRRGGRLVGRVIDSGRNPIEGAQVALPNEGFLADMAQALTTRGTTTDEGGRFAMHQLPASNFDLTVTHGDFSPLTTDVIAVTEGRETNVGNLTMLRGGGIIGYAFDAGGEPLEGAGIFLNGPDDFDSIVTDALGEFAFTRLTPGQYRVTLNESGRSRRAGGTQISQTVTVREGENTEVILACEPGYAVSGLVTFEGNPIRNIEVRLTAHSDDTPLGESGADTSGGDGAYRIENLSPALYSVAVQEVQRRRRIPLRTDTLSVHDSDVVFDIELPQSTISGRVTSTLGEPIDRARVSLFRDSTPTDIAEAIIANFQQSASTRTDSDGIYEFDRVEEGRIAVVAQSSDGSLAYQIREITLGLGEEVTGIDFALIMAGRLVGRAVARDNGQPIPSFRAMLTDSTGVLVLNRTIDVSAEGDYVIDGLAEGQHEISAFADNFAPLYNLPITIRAGDDTPRDLEFENGGTLDVTVGSSDGDPIAGASVSICDHSGRVFTLPPNWNLVSTYYSDFQTDEMGHVTREHVPAGEFLLQVTPPSAHFTPPAQSITIRNNAPTPVSMTLGPAE